MFVPLLTALAGCSGCRPVPVSVEPENPRRGLDSLHCATGLDEDAEVSWTVDGRSLGVHGALPAAQTARGTEFSCTVDAGGRTGRATIRPAPAGGNVLLIVLDDVGNDKIAAYGEHPRPPATPHMDALAESLEPVCEASNPFVGDTLTAFEANLFFWDTLNLKSEFQEMGLDKIRIYTLENCFSQLQTLPSRSSMK